MQSQFDSERLSLRSNLITTDRPDSSQLVDLHVYVIPKNIWRDRQNLAENEAMDQAISAGFVRVPPNLTIHDLRPYILKICGQDNEFPREFIYLRSVGRCLTKVKSQQETDLRVKNYRPPITVAPEIYVLEGNSDDDPLITVNTKRYLFRESPIHQSLLTPPELIKSRQQSWVKSLDTPTPPQLIRSRQQSWVRPLITPTPPELIRSRQQSWVKPLITPTPPQKTKYSSFVHSNERQNSTDLNGPAIASFSNLSTASSTLSARDLAKLREEQERLRLRQIELARQRREIEQEQQRREKELLAKREYISKEQQEKQEIAAIRIQATYRGYRTRRKIKDEQQKREHAANEIERLQKEARELTRRKAEEEHAEEIEAHDVVKYSNRLDELKTKRVELEANREAIVRRMQQLHAQISVRRKEERDLWKQKYLIEKTKTNAFEERTRMASQDQQDLNSQVEQAKIRLNNSTKLRQQAENECRVLRQELQQIRSNITTIEKHPLPKQSPSSQQQPQTIPISLDITLQY